jgi:hypothetical protein
MNLKGSLQKRSKRNEIGLFEQKPSESQIFLENWNHYKKYFMDLDLLSYRKGSSL